jgi:hypothetical protein
MTVDRAKLLAQHCVREASILIESLNEHYQRTEKMEASTPHVADVRVAEILNRMNNLPHELRGEATNQPLVEEIELDEKDLKLDDSSEDKT